MLSTYRLIALALMVVGLIVAWDPIPGTAAQEEEKPARPLVVPDLKGLEIREVRRHLLIISSSFDGPIVEFEEIWRPHLSVPRGVVANQVPQAGALLDPSRQVIFVDISSDPGIKLPHLIGASPKAALDRLSWLGLEGRPECQGLRIGDHDDVVIQSDPAPGTYVVPGSVIHLRIECSMVMVNIPWEIPRWRELPCLSFYSASGESFLRCEPFTVTDSEPISIYDLYPHMDSQDVVRDGPGVIILKPEIFLHNFDSGGLGGLHLR